MDTASKSTLSRIGEAIALIGIIGSLVFVGTEVRQSAIATRAATDASIADAFREVNLAMATSPDLARAMTNYGEDPDSASAADQVQILGLWRSLFHVWSNAHRQQLNGTIDPAILQSIVQEISVYAEASPADTMTADLARRGRVMRWAWAKERSLQSGLSTLRRWYCERAPVIPVRRTCPRQH